METPSLTHDTPAIDASGSPPSPPIEHASLPDEWKSHVHPNGLPYSTCDRHRAVTSADVNNLEVLQQVEACINKIKRRMQTRGIDFSGDCEIFVELSNDQPGAVDHLMVDHKKKRTFRIPDQGPPVYGSQYEYWNHFCRTPMHHSLPGDAEDDMLAHISDDRKTTSPLSYEQCEQLISLYETLRTETPEAIGIRAWFVSRVLACIWKARKSYRYGEPDAITTIEPEEEEPRSWTQHFLNIFLYVLCFGTHERYLTQLRHAHTNGGLHVTAFQKFLGGMLQEWADSNLLGTVFISANMAFLAIPVGDSILEAQYSILKLD
ncbi:hypothetical protein BU17DRAFT_98990 [Hysterangium stoloniferum]|nr:hypothetical protein BU17DRAFT_98990 [Hysterangium stoloniferum]